MDPMSVAAKVRAKVEEGELKEQLLQWTSVDSNVTTLSALSTLLDLYPANGSDLKKRFLNRLEFGTAGLRGPMGCGFNCMNDVTIFQTSQGLCAYLKGRFGAEAAKSRGVVIGYDGRHNSQRFAHITAAVFLVGGFKVYLNSKVTATPMNPYCVVKYRCLAGVQVTASHNPKNDNGYKVYADNGAQIVPPMDADVAEQILANLSRWSGVDELLDKSSGLLKDLSQVADPYDELFASYMQEITADLSRDRDVTCSSSMKIVYTAMHGVGFPFVEEILRRFGFPSSNFIPVEEQKLPDPEFSTVSFPNPEEKGALDLAMALADKHQASMVIANDPDADRFACAEKGKDGKWHIFSGDELGIILGHRCMRLAEMSGVPKEKMLMICSAVSSRMLEKMAKIENANFEETMTGFKWMMNCALDAREKKDLFPVFVYEEALGYACDIRVPDKDGVSAAAVWVELACKLHSQGKTVAEHLDELRKRYGYFVSNNSYFLCYDKQAITNLFDEFRSDGAYKDQVGEFKVSRVRDVTTGFDSSMTNKKCAFPLSPSSQMVTLFFENEAVMTLRTSGTEPKLKWYSEMSGSDPRTASCKLQEVVQSCIENILQPSKYPLQPAA